MKLKKLFAGIVAVAMMATMAIPGFAAGTEEPSYKNDDGTTKYFTASDSIDLSKVYTIKAGTAPAEKFEFTLTPGKAYAGPEDNAKEITMPQPTKTTGYEVEWDSALSQSDTKTFSIALSSLNITNVGVYNYTISESKAKGTPGVSYAGDIHMKVTVVHPSNDSNALVYYVALRDVKTDAKKSNTNAFENIYGDGNVHSITLSKTIHGNFGSLNDTFVFQIKLHGTTGKTYAGATVSTTDTGVTLPENKTITIGADDYYEVTLGHGQSVTISNIPDDVTYEIIEKNSALDADSGKVMNNGYTVTLKHGDTAASFTDNVKATGEIKSDVSVDFHNTHDGEIDTGVILDNAPYIALLTIVAAGAVVMIMKKRRSYED